MNDSDHDLLILRENGEPVGAIKRKPANTPNKSQRFSVLAKSLTRLTQEAGLKVRQAIQAAPGKGDTTANAITDEQAEMLADLHI